MEELRKSCVIYFKRISIAFLNSDYTLSVQTCILRPCGDSSHVTAPYNYYFFYIINELMNIARMLI